MERFNKREKGTDPNLKIAVISGTIAVLTLLENLLDLRLPLSTQSKWIIFGVFSLIAIIFFAIVFFRPSETVPVPRSSITVRPISPNIQNYLNATQNRPEVNPVRIHAGKFQVTLNTSQTCSIRKEPLIDQSVYWRLEGSNISRAAMASFTIAVSLSAYTSWRDGTITFCARLKKKDKTYPINVMDWKEPSSQDSEDIRFLTFKFPPKVQCIYAEPFIFELDMIWNRGAHFHNIERYFSDPVNYGKRVDALTIEVISDSQDILGRYFQLYRISRGQPGLSPLEPPEQTEWAPVSWTVTPQSDELYVIEIRK